MTDHVIKPDSNEPGVRIVELSRMTSVELLRLAMSPAGILRVIMHELLTEIPGADFIEIRAVRFDSPGGNDERSPQPVPDAEPPAAQ